MNSPLVIAEAGNNHEGDVVRAVDLLNAAWESGADIVKFQAGTAEGFTSDPNQYPKYQRFELSKNDYDLLVHRSIELEVPIMFSVWPIDSWRWEEYRRFKYFKIAARQCTKQNIAKYATESTFISIPHTLKDPELLGIRKGIPMHCVSEYPATDPQLFRMLALKMKLQMEVGYSDHAVGIEACKQAIDMGAVAIEKHFTLNKKQSGFRDHALSATPKELKELVDYAKGKK